MRQFLLVLMMMLQAIAASADVSLNLQSDALQITVNNLVLRGVGENADADLDLSTLNDILQQERADYGDDMTVDELHQIADRLTLYVRDKGYLFHTIYLPPQRVKNGVVVLNYQAARLTDLNLINRSKIADRRFRAALADLLGKTLYAPAVESRILALKAQPGLEVFAFYSRGAKPNDIRLNIKITEGRRVGFTLRGENYGSDATGKNRLVAETRLQRLTGLDELSLALLTTAGAGDSLYGFINYARSFGDLRTQVVLGVGDTRYSLGQDFSALEMSGDSRTYRFELARQTYFSSASKMRLSLGGGRRQSRISSDFDSSLENREQSDLFNLSVSGQFRIGDGSQQMGYGLDFLKGSYRFEPGGTAPSSVEDTDMSKLVYSLYHAWSAAPDSRGGVSFFTHLRGQWTADPLPGIESLGLGGVYGVRAIPPGAYSADAGALLTLEMKFPRLLYRASWPDTFVVPVVFFDMAVGQNFYDDPGFDTNTRLAGWGLGLDFSWRSLFARAAYATPTQATISSDTSTGEFKHDDQWMFEMRWSW